MSRAMLVARFAKVNDTLPPFFLMLGGGKGEQMGKWSRAHSEKSWHRVLSLSFLSVRVREGLKEELPVSWGEGRRRP